MQSKVCDRMDDNLSKPMIDYSKYYKKDGDDAYSVHFSNKNKLTVNEIEKIFSTYGDVLCVNITGNDYGFRFVKYKTLDEIVSCIRGLANSDIQLLPEKSKLNGFHNKLDHKNLNQWQTARMENSYHGTSTAGKQNNINSARNGNFSRIESLTHNGRISNEDNRFDKCDNSSSNSSSKSSTRSFKSNENGTKCDQSEPAVFNSQTKQNSPHNSSNNIDYEKYYKIAKDGTFIVHFANRKRLAKDEINNIFSSYGHVVSIHPNENRSNGLVFVRYETLEEVKKCLIGLQNNDMICILLQKTTINGTMKKPDQGYSQLAGTQDSFIETDKRLNSNFNYKKSSDGEEKSIHNKTFNRDRCNNTDNFSDVPQSLMHNYKSAVTHSSISNGQHSLLSEKSSVNRKVSGYDEEQQWKNKPHSFTKPGTITSMNKNKSDNKVSAVFDKERKQDFDAMSNSSSQFGTKKIPSNVIIIPMQEIIVANIHTNYDVNYILHLFKKFNPISATFIMTILGTDIRYCHVYFKTEEDAVTIEEEFDNFDLSGKNLIILRNSQLIEEAMCK